MKAIVTALAITITSTAATAGQTGWQYHTPSNDYRFLTETSVHFGDPDVTVRKKQLLFTKRVSEDKWRHCLHVMTQIYQQDVAWNNCFVHSHEYSGIVSAK